MAAELFAGGAAARVIRHTPYAERLALSFDDGPDPQYTPALLELLARYRVRASFFLIGREAARRPALVRRIAAAGHEIGNHGWSHRHPLRCSPREAAEEVHRGAAALAELLGRPVNAYRPPHGRLRRAQLQAAEAEGQLVVLWSRSLRDWGPWAGRGAIGRRLRRARPGEILLLHDGRNRHNRPWNTLPALAAFLHEARAREMQLGPVLGG